MKPDGSAAAVNFDTFVLEFMKINPNDDATAEIQFPGDLAPVRSRRSASQFPRVPMIPGFRPAAALVMGLVCSGFVAAAMLPDSKPKEWPANPDKHKVTIRREAANERESAMIAAAEAAQPAMEELRKVAGEGAVPAGGKGWWYQQQLGIRIPYAVTADAVAYYSELVANYGKQGFNRFMEPSSHLDYHASLKHHPEFKLDGKTFKDVHVVTLKLDFAQRFAATPTEGMDFQKQRIVILDAKGKVLHISGDGPTEALVMAI